MTRWKEKREKKKNLWIEILEAQVTARVRLNASSNSKQTNLIERQIVIRSSTIDCRWELILISDDISLNSLFSRKEKKSWCYHLKRYAWKIHESTVMKEWWLFCSKRFLVNDVSKDRAWRQKLKSRGLSSWNNHFRVTMTSCVKFQLIKFKYS